MRSFPCLFVFALIFLATAISASCAWSDTVLVPIDTFQTVAHWRQYADGGEMTIGSAKSAGPGGAGAMELSSPCDPQHWGNAAIDVPMPPNVSAVDFDFSVRSKSPSSEMYVWLWQASGDGFVARVIVGGKGAGEAGMGWHHAHVPLTDFGFEPRGTKVKNWLTVDRLMLGVGNIPTTVDVANLDWEEQSPSSDAVLHRTPGLVAVKGTNGAVGILSADYPALPGDSNPKAIAAALTAAGYGATLLQPGDLADPAVLTPSNFDVVVFPYGGRYPTAANASIKAYLKAGGSFLSTGGYAFDDPVGQHAPTASDLSNPAYGTGSEARLNARVGTDGDVTRILPDQIAVFDPGNPILNSALAAPAPGQYVFDAKPESAEFAGYAASAMLANNNPVTSTLYGKREPLLELYDSQGRDRGAAGALAYLYGGPYSGASWAFFGVDNRDLFSPDGPLLAQLPRIVGALIRKTYVQSVESDLLQYRSGETVRLKIVVANDGKSARFATLLTRLTGRDSTRSQLVDRRAMTLAPHERTTVTLACPLPSWPDDLVRVDTTLRDAQGPIDTMGTGFTIYRAAIAAKAVHLGLAGNYFADGRRRVLMTGTDVTGSMIYSGLENPLQWDGELQRMRDCGLSVLRILHGSPFYNPDTHQTTIPPGPITSLPPRFLRTLDALVQLTEYHHIVLIYDMEDWADVAITSDDLQRQAQVAQILSARFGADPGMIIDVRNEPSTGTVDSASGRRDQGTDQWADMRTSDFHEFQTNAMNRWIADVAGGVRRGDPHRLVETGFLQGYVAFNKLLGEDSLDIASMHSYTGLDDLRGDLALFNDSVDGKGLTLTEFGDVPDHGSRATGIVSKTPDTQRYLTTGHYVFGIGGAMMSNWCWKDMDDVIFPWGVNYPGGGPRKATLLAYRNMTLMLRQVRPVYTSEPVYMVIPTAEMQGPRLDRTTTVLYKTLDYLQLHQIPFGVIKDIDLARLPTSARFLLYPAAFTIPDQSYPILKNFVQQGGTLYLTGDYSFGAGRRHAHLERLVDLGGVTFKPTSDDPWLPALLNAPAEHRLGQGTVVTVFDASDTEDSYLDKTLGTYLTRLHLPRWTSPTPVFVYRLLEQGGAKTYLMVNPTSHVQTVKITCERVPATVALAAECTGMVRYVAGDVCGVESEGQIVIGSTTLNSTGHLALITLDSQNLLTARAAILIPFEAASIDLSPLVAMSGCRGRGIDLLNGDVVATAESHGPTVGTSGETTYDIRVIAPPARMPEIGRTIADAIELR